MLIRTATAAEAPCIAHIHVETWRVAYRGQMPDAVLDALNAERRTVFWQERLTQKRGQVFVAEDDGRIVGFCDLIPSRDTDAHPSQVAEIAALYILPEHWRKGAGRALCKRILAEARGRGYKVLTLWGLASNAGAQGFYETMGFALDGATKTERTTDGNELHEVRFRMAI
ncbi:MAG: GNAT family N-acetyltransferase [Verrucomicrobiota bacterium]|jgi:GNAT superfamily N-acetyltransferase